MSAYFSEPTRAVTILYELHQGSLSLLRAMAAVSGPGPLATAVGLTGIDRAARANRWRGLHCEHSTDKIVSSPNPVNIKFIFMKKPVVRLAISNVGCAR